MNIMVNKKVIQNEVKKCDTSIEEFSNCIASLKKKVIDVEKTWKNQEYNHFSSKMNTFITDLEKFHKQLNSCIRFVEAYVNAQEMLEKEYKTREINIE